MRLNTPFRYISESIKDFDVYGKTITFTYKGKDQYKTFIGGVISIIMLIIALLYGVNLFIIMIGRDNTNTTVSTIIKDLSNDSEVIELNKSKFQLAFSVTYNGLERITQNNSYFTIAFNQHSFDSENRNRSEISYSVWGDRFNYDFPLQSTADVVSSEFLCPDSNDFELLGNGFAVDQKFFEILIEKCVNGSGVRWESDMEIEKAINSLEVRFMMVNAYFDVDEYQNPIRTYIEDRLSFSGIEGLTSNVEFFLKANEAQTKDSYLSIIPTEKNYEFVNLDTIKNTLSSSDLVLNFRFIKSNQKQKIERSVFTFLDLLGLIGGVFEFFSILGGVLVYTIADKLFYYSILSSLYQVDTGRCQKDHQKEFSQKMNLESWETNRHRFQETNQILPMHIAENFTSNLNYEDKLATVKNNRLKNTLIDSAKNNIYSRRAYNYKASDIFYNLLCCCWLKRCS